MNQRDLFYQRHLNRVSRSFAFCIERLEDPLRSQVGLSYLICRVLDSVEDAAWPEAEAQALSFRQFESFILTAPTKAQVESWVSEIPDDLPDGERLLLADAHVIFSDFHAESESLRAILREPVLSMCRGMMHFAQQKRNGELRLRSLAEVNQYCFFVAGVVGEILTRLITEQREALKVPPEALAGGRRFLVDGFHFGLFLQKVNLLKDQRQDEQARRFLVPSREDVLSSLKVNAAAAIRYVLGLPETLQSYRLFCSWSLFLGLASLPWIERSYAELSALKIPREQARVLFAEIEKIVGQNSRLLEFFTEMLEGAGLAASVPGAKPLTLLAPRDARPTSSELLPSFRQLYRGILNESEVEALLALG